MNYEPTSCTHNMPDMCAQRVNADVTKMQSMGKIRPRSVFAIELWRKKYPTHHSRTFAAADSAVLLSLENNDFFALIYSFINLNNLSAFILRINNRFVSLQTACTQWGTSSERKSVCRASSWVGPDLCNNYMCINLLTVVEQ